MTTADIWRTRIVAQGDRMAALAMHELNDQNAAHAVVHDVMWSAMTDMLGPVSPRQLDSALCAALREHTTTTDA